MKVKVARGSTVKDFIRKLDQKDKAIVVALRDLITQAAPTAEVSIKWGCPWWTLNGFLCAVYVAGDHVNLAFSRGIELSDPNGLLEGTGKGMRHIKVRDLSDVKKTKFTALIRQAVTLNRLTPKAAR